MSAAPTLSVILPVRNAERTLVEALDSVLGQTFRAFEVIAVDDGSTDASLRLLQQAAERDGRVRIVPGGGGVTAALNRGIAAAAGRFIARQDADDISMPERFERQLDWLDRHPGLCAVGTAAIAVDEGGRPIRRLRIPTGPTAVRKGLRGARRTPVHGSMMMRRECLTAVGGYRQAFAACQDLDLWLRFVERYELDNIGEPLYRWRLSASSVYGSHRIVHLLYGGIALAFAAERARFGGDSYERLQQFQADLDGFAEGYRLRGLLHALWGDLLLRGTRDSRIARHHLRLARTHGYLSWRSCLLWGWTSLGLPWIGTKPLRAAGAAVSRGGAR